MHLKSTLTGPLKWLSTLAVVGIYPFVLVYAFAPGRGLGKASYTVMTWDFGIAILGIAGLVLFHYLERAIKSWQHWKRVAHKSDTPFLLGEESATVFRAEYIWLPIAIAFNLLACMGIAFVIQVAMKLFFE